MPRRCCLLLLPVLLFGCSQTPELVLPAPPVAQTWPTAEPSTAGQQASKVHWRQFFGDPRLQALIAAALENNRDLRLAVARVAEARAQFGISRADRLPSANLNLAASNTGSPVESNGSTTTVITERFDLSLTTVSYELDFWGRLAGLSEAAKNNYLATEEARRAAYVSLVAEVAVAYFSLVEMDAIWKVARSTLASREQTFGLIQQAVDAGGADELELQQARSVLESARAYLDAVVHQRNVAQNRLNYLVGATPSSLPDGLALEQQAMGVALAPGLPGEVLLLRPDVAAAEQRLQAANANVGAARAAFWPKVVLTAGTGVAGKTLETLFNGATWAFQPTMALPLFDWGRNAANRDLAEARKVSAVVEYERTIQMAFREVADLLSARQSLQRQLQAAIANEVAQNRRFEIVLARYEAGLTSYMEVLDAHRALLSAQQASIQVRRTQLESAAQLYKAMGGGTTVMSMHAGGGDGSQGSVR